MLHINKQQQLTLACLLNYLRLILEVAIWETSLRQHHYSNVPVGIFTATQSSLQLLNPIYKPLLVLLHSSNILSNPFPSITRPGNHISMPYISIPTAYYSAILSSQTMPHYSFHYIFFLTWPLSTCLFNILFAFCFF